VKKVEGEGPLNAKLVLVGEALGEQEEFYGRPFIGPAGQHLRRMLADAGIREREVYFTNVVPVRPPKNKLALLPGWERFIPELHNRLEQIRPNIVVPLGATALGALAGTTEITKWRGSVFKSNGRKLLPSFHPSWLLRGQFGMTPVVTHDLKRAFRESEFPEVRRKERTFHVMPSFEDALEFLACLQHEPSPVCVDIENHPNYELACVGVGNSETEAMSIPFTSNRHVHYWRDYEEVVIWRELLKLWRTRPLIGQNLSWDMTILCPLLASPNSIFMDTMLAHQTLFPEWPHGLDFLTSWYTDIPYYKDEGKIEEKGRSEEERAEYNCKDVVSTYECAMKMTEELKSSGLAKFYWMHCNPLVRLYWKMSMRGMPVSVPLLRKKKDELKTESEKILKEIEEEAGFPVNPNSFPQVSDFLYKHLKLPRRHKKGKVTTDQNALEDLQAYYPSPILSKILEYRHKTKLVGDKLQVRLWKPGLYNSNFNPAGTESGQLSASKFLGAFGSNLQNVDPEIRNIFAAQKGETFLIVDQKQAEAAVVFWLARDEKWKALYNRKVSTLEGEEEPEGSDVHQYVASTCAEKIGKEVVRFTAKRMVHGSNYDMGPVTFAKYVKCSVKEGSMLSEAYHAAFPNVRGVYHRDVRDRLVRIRTLSTIWGRKRQFLGPMKDHLFKEGFSYEPQSTIRDLTHHAALWLEEVSKEYEGVTLRLNTHDGLVIGCPVELVPIWAELCKKAFKVPLLVGGDVLEVRVEVKVSKEWK